MTSEVTTKIVVHDFCHKHLATSPHSKDKKRRRLDPHVYEEAQALIVQSSLARLHDLYVKENPQHKVPFM